ncbi:acyl-CoA reductase [Bifidobacterium sp. SMB2]|uniref:Acyl-CoA reductase n=1 Tax=Bifidobacterium saimiriisciurei TaxID=2661627 RepID=A0ABX0C7L4_9BIFI|nr:MULTISPECIES: acyl-CoA reductase [Bifidobacterium]NEG95695.1 acyl-CoA reductase [Bifidobacterium sp. SMB2]NEH11122.1 acyl-CoA reductase [Bifidobacterium saimiriisciurei]
MSGDGVSVGGNVVDNADIVDVFHAPAGFSFTAFDTREITTPDGPVSLRYPRLDADVIHALCDDVRKNRNDCLASMPVNDIIDVLAKAVELWTDPDYPLRRLAERLVPAITGYDADMTRIELKRYMRMFRRRELLRFVDDDLPCPQMLDEYRPNRSGGYTRLYGPDLSFHVFSSNVPGIPVWSMTMGLLVKSGIVGKSSFDEPLMPVLFAKSIREVDPELADAIAVVPWKGGTQPLEDAAIGEANAVIVYGSSHTTELLRPKVAEGKPFLSYGARIGFSLVGRESLRADCYESTIHRMAVDVATYDQQSCLAAQTVFVERGGVLAPHETAELLAHELESQQRKYPRSTPTQEESLAIRRVRSSVEMMSLFAGGPGTGMADDGSGPFVIASPNGTDWTVLHYPDAASLPTPASPLNRTITVVAVDDLADALPVMAPYRQWLQSCGVAVDSTRLFPLAQRVGELGIDRICPVGEMNRAKSGWHHDGGFNLLDLVRAVDVERGTDRFADSFDDDFE